MGIKKKIYNIIREDDLNDVWSNVFDGMIIFLISLNVLLVILDTFNLPEWALHVSSMVEAASVVVFTVEYLIRLWTADLAFPDRSGFAARIRHLVSFMAMIDLLAIVPFYLPFLIPVDLRILRVFRLFRLARLLKFNRYTDAFSNVIKVVKSKSSILISSSIVVLVLMVISSVIMYNFESEVQPETFRNAFSGFWWTLNTITTVGYGDIYPVTLAGRILSGVISILGIGLVAVPTGIITSGFVEVAEEKEIRSSVVRSLHSDLLLLADMRNGGMLTEEEYRKQREQVLNQ